MYLVKKINTVSAPPAGFAATLTENKVVVKTQEKSLKRLLIPHINISKEQSGQAIPLI